MSDLITKINISSYDDLLAALNASIANKTAWIEIDNALFIELADETQICIEHTASYERDRNEVIYSDLQYVQLSDEDCNVIDVDIDSDDMVTLIEIYLDKCEPNYTSQDEYDESVYEQRAEYAHQRSVSGWLDA